MFVSVGATARQLSCRLEARYLQEARISIVRRRAPGVRANGNRFVEFLGLDQHVSHVRASLRRSVGEPKITNSPSTRGGSGSRLSPDPFSLDGVHVSSPLRFLLPPQTSRSGTTKIDSPARFFLAWGIHRDADAAHEAVRWRDAGGIVAT